MEPSRVALTRVSPSGVNFMMCAGRMSEPVTFTLFNDTTGNSNSASSYNVLSNGFHYSSSYALNLFKKIFGGQSVLFVGPLISLFWTSGDVCPGIQRPGRSLTILHVLSPACDGLLRTSMCDTC